MIESVKKGLYIVGRFLGTERRESALLANHILNDHKASRKFQTGIHYTYTNLPLPFYAFGLATVNLSKDQQAIMQSWERYYAIKRVLCDKIATTAGITLRSQSSASDYVFGNLRMEEGDLAKFDLNAMSSWLENAPKRESLEMLIKIIEKISLSTDKIKSMAKTFP